MTQLDLVPDWETLWADDRRLLRRMAEAIGLKQVAYELDVAPSQLSHALDERERNLPAKWVRYLLRAAPKELREAYVRGLATMIGCELAEAPVMTPEQELAALKAALAESLGPELRQAVLAKVGKRR